MLMWASRKRRIELEELTFKVLTYRSFVQFERNKTRGDAVCDKMPATTAKGNAFDMTGEPHGKQLSRQLVVVRLT